MSRDLRRIRPCITSLIKQIIRFKYRLYVFPPTIAELGRLRIEELLSSIPLIIYVRQIMVIIRVSTNIQLDIFAKHRSIEKIIPSEIVITVRIFESRFLNGRTGKGGFIRYDLITHVIVCKISLQILPSRGYKLSQRRTNSIGKFGFRSEEHTSELQSRENL